MLKKRMLTILLAVTVALMMMPVTAMASTEDGVQSNAEKIIVAFNDNVSDSKMEKVVEKTAGELENTVSTENENIASIALDENVNTEEVLNEYESLDEVEYAEPDVVCETLTTDQATASNSNDKVRGSQWYMDTVKAESAWAIADSYKKEKVTVAVLDTGVNVNHADLQKSLNKNTSADVVNETSNGEPTKLTKDILGHGTHVAGIIAATSNNGIGTAGVAAGKTNSLIDLMCVNVFTPMGTSAGAYSSDIAQGIIYATDKGAKVINMSLGTTSDSMTISRAIDYATEAGVVIVCAAGNDSTSKAYYPSDYSNTISVIATDKNNGKASYSNYGAAKTLSAPGTGIYSTLKNGSYGSMSGTSMASPVVAATAAMMKAVKPEMTVSEVKNTLCNTATDIGATGKDTQTGAGLVNAYKAVQTAAGVKAESNPTTKTSTVVTKPGKVANVKAKKYAAKTAKVTWKKVSGATGYVVYTAKPGKSYEKARTVSASAVKCTVAKLAKGKNKVKVRAYKKVSGKAVYGAYSNVSTCKL